MSACWLRKPDGGTFCARLLLAISSSRPQSLGPRRLFRFKSFLRGDPLLFFSLQLLSRETLLHLGDFGDGIKLPLQATKFPFLVVTCGKEQKRGPE